MTVAELIEALSEVDQNMNVIVAGFTVYKDEDHRTEFRRYRSLAKEVSVDVKAKEVTVWGKQVSEIDPDED